MFFRISFDSNQFWVCGERNRSVLHSATTTSFRFRFFCVCVVDAERFEIKIKMCSPFSFCGDREEPRQVDRSNTHIRIQSSKQASKQTNKHNALPLSSKFSAFYSNLWALCCCSGRINALIRRRQRSIGYPNVFVWYCMRRMWSTLVVNSLHHFILHELLVMFSDKDLFKWTFYVWHFKDNESLNHQSTKIINGIAVRFR